MTVSTAWPYESIYDRTPPQSLTQRILGGTALVCVAFACAWTIVNLGGSRADTVAAGRGDRLAFAASRGDRLTIASLPQAVAIDIAAFDSRFSAAFPSAAISGGVPLADTADLPSQLANAPPHDRSARAELAPAPRSRRYGRPQTANLKTTSVETPVATDAPADQPTFFERLFGKQPQSAIFAKLFGPPPSNVTLAYAAPESVAGDGAGIASGLYDRQTAVYDISTHTVYLPDGQALEAHSGLGPLIDDPRYADRKDRGPTPPDLYDLQPRGRLFHGVRALRLIPEDQAKVFGRRGLLAHSYMLGPNGQSNGCVSFKDYDAFLQAYENRRITRLAVVSRLD
jgi:hypothetical protein